MKAPKDHTLEFLLNLDGFSFRMKGGLKVDFEVRAIKPTAERPHGIKYSLNLTKNGQSILRYDNAHGYKEHRKIEYDHKHQAEKVFPYDFVDAERLLEHFYNEVKTIKDEHA